MGWVSLVSMLTKLGLKLLARYDRAQARSVIQEGQKRIQQLEEAYDEDPVDATRDFWGDDSS